MTEVFRRHWLVTVGLAFAGVLVLFIGWNVLQPERDPAVEALRQQGLPVSLKELNAWYRPVPPDRNAALTYEQAFTLPCFADIQGSSDPSLDITVMPGRGQHFKPADRQELTAFLAKNQEALRLLHSVGDGLSSRYSLDLNQGFLTLLPHLAKVKKAALLLTTEAWLAADAGKTEKAADALLAAGRLGRSLDEEPIIISQLVRVASWGVVISRIERILSLAPLEDTNLVALQEMVRSAERPQAMLRAMAGEEAFGLSMFTQPRSQAQIFGFQNGTPSQSERLRTGLAISALKATGLLRKDKQVYLQVMATNLAAARTPYPERVDRARQAGNLASTLPTKFCIFSRMMLPAVWRAMLKEADHTARCRTADAALAVERFRRAHNGALPASLDALVPAYLPKVPSDPYSGQPLLFKPLNPGFVVYSVGEDGRDDGGVEPNSKQLSQPHDITFIIGR